MVIEDKLAEAEAARDIVEDLAQKVEDLQIEKKEYEL